MNLLRELWPQITAIAVLVINIVAAGHAVLYKRDSRSAVGWIGLIFLVPFFGALLYVLLGINRIQRKATSLRTVRFIPTWTHPSQSTCSAEDLKQHLGADAEHLMTLARIGDGVIRKPLLSGNSILPLKNGDEAFPAMLEAIRQAQTSITLVTYIFDNDHAGKLFVEALHDAVQRGVEVRVLIDYVGSRYTFPSVVWRLRRAGVKTARFIPTFLPWRTVYMNLRSHRKIMVVDGHIGFTGGINIRIDNMLALKPPYRVQDLHFRITGPVVGQMQQAFIEDWAFTTDEKLEGVKWLPSTLTAEGNVMARGITDGPDEDYDILRRVILGALACARRRVRIVTPYFLPDVTLISALNIATMRGIDVQIVLPEVNNLRMVDWAATAQIWQVLQRGCRILKTPPPFDHSKIMLVDDAWGLVGSANWDPRSLRLNFEFNVELYDKNICAQLNSIIDEKLKGAHEVTLKEVNSRPLPIKLRDGIARLFSPYL